MAEILHFFNIPFIWTHVENQPKEAFELMVYPNPVINSLNIRINTTSAGNYSVSLIDLLGRNINHSDQNLMLKEGTNALQMDVSALVGGVYFLIVKTPAGEVTKKIMIN